MYCLKEPLSPLRHKINKKINPPKKIQDLNSTVEKTHHRLGQWQVSYCDHFPCTECSVGLKKRKKRKKQFLKNVIIWKLIYEDHIAAK